MAVGLTQHLRKWNEYLLYNGGTGLTSQLPGRLRQEDYTSRPAWVKKELKVSLGSSLRLSQNRKCVWGEAVNTAQA